MLRSSFGRCDAAKVGQSRAQRRRAGDYREKHGEDCACVDVFVPQEESRSEPG